MDVLGGQERGGHVAAPSAEVIFVDDHNRGAVLCGDLRQRHTRDGDYPVLLAFCAAGPNVGRQVVEVAVVLLVRR